MNCRPVKVEMNARLLSWWLLVAALLHPGDVAGQLTAAPLTCPNDTFTFTCTVTGNISGITIWRVGTSGNITQLALVHRLTSNNSIGLFTAKPGTGFGTNGPTFTSTLSGTATPALEGKPVECFGPANNVKNGNLVESSTLQIVAPPPAPYIIDVGYLDRQRFSVEWMEAPGSQMVNGFTFSTTPTGLSCTNNSMTTVTCSYNERNLNKNYTFTVAALYCGTQKGNEAFHRIHLRASGFPVPPTAGLEGSSPASSLERGVIYGLVGVIVIIVILVVIACLIWRMKNKSHGRKNEDIKLKEQENGPLPADADTDKPPQLTNIGSAANGNCKII